MRHNKIGPNESDLMAEKTKNMNNITDDIKYTLDILQELKNDRKFTFFF